MDAWQCAHVPLLNSIKEDCLANAEHCYSMARLVALQLNLLQVGKQVINLDTQGVNRFMAEQPFNEVGMLDES